MHLIQSLDFNAGVLHGNLCASGCITGLRRQTLLDKAAVRGLQKGIRRGPLLQTAFSGIQAARASDENQTRGLQQTFKSAVIANGQQSEAQADNVWTQLQ